MKKFTFFVVAFMLLAVLFFYLDITFFKGKKAYNEAIHTDSEMSTSQAANSSQVSVAYYGMPMSFVANQGQVDKHVKFLVNGSGYSLFLTPNEMVLSLDSRLTQEKTGNPLSQPSMGLSEYPTSMDQPLSRAALAQETESKNRSVLRMKLVGTDINPQVVGLDRLPGKTNYFIGNDPAKWQTNVPNYSKVKYKSVYPGVDLVLYGNQRQLEYDFIVTPGIDPQSITFGFEGAEKIELDDKGNLLIQTHAGQIRQNKPIIYQEVDGIRNEIEGGYSLCDNHQLNFWVDEYDVSHPLVIDPVLLYSTFLGGSGGDNGTCLAVDAAGFAYIAGNTYSTDFPTVNPLQPNPGGDGEFFVAKINPTGSAYVYVTYLGGSNIDYCWGIATDDIGNAYITGLTYSDNFPTVNAAQSNQPGTDAFVAKLNPSGSILVYSTYLGGIFQDHGNGIAVDASGNAYITGWTGSEDFPTVNALQPSKGGISNIPDAFVTKLNSSGTAFVYSTFLGGSYPADEYGEDIAVDTFGNAYVTGHTRTPDFPVINAFQPTIGDNNTSGGGDAFISKLNASGSELVYSTYLGGDGGDGAFDITVDASGNVYLTGYTRSSNFPTANALQSTLNNYRDAFVVKLNAAGSALLFSTYLGGSDYRDGSDIGMGIAVDTAGRIYITGGTGSDDFPLKYPYQSVIGTGGDPLDAFVTCIDPTVPTLIYSTYLGGDDREERGDGIGIDAYGNVYIAGETSSADFPTLNPLQAVMNGSNDAFIAKFSKVTCGAVSGTVSSNATGLQGVTVKLLENDLPANVVAETSTNALGQYSFSDILINEYQVMIIVPLGYTVNQNFVLASLLCSETNVVDFDLTCSSSYWTPTSLTDAPPAQAEFSAVWTGNKMIVWGGQGAGDAGGIYDPATDTWIPTSTVNVPTARSEHIAIWTGSKMIVWGGRGVGNTGGIYDPVTDTWTATSTTNAPVNGVERVAVWTGSKMLIWGGDSSSIGGIYDPVTDTWSTISSVNAPTPREETVAVWTGNKMIVRGDGSDGIYDPITDTWSSITPVNAPPLGGDGVAVWTGNKMIVWGGSGTNEGGIYDPVTDTWSSMTTDNAPAIREDAVAFWNGSKMIVWGGSPSTGTIVNSGGTYDPVIDAWTETSTCNAPSPRENFAAVWTGSKMIVWGGNTPNGITNTGGIYSYPNTTAGTNVQVTLPDATITFSQVDQAGTTSLETSTTGPTPPNGFELGNPPTYYDITTTAVFPGPIEICINYSGTSFGDESNLKLYHFENNGWVDRTVSLDTDANIICASVTSLSPFAIFEPDLGIITGHVSVNENPIAGVTVKLLDNNTPTDMIDESTTDSQGEYTFHDVPAGEYQIMIVEPLGYLVGQNFVVTNLLGGETNTVDFVLTEIVIVNDARPVGYWKHQFDVYVLERGNAQESEAELQSYIDGVINRYNSHFNIFLTATDGVDDFADWQAILSVRGNAGTEEKAKAQLAALIMNLMSLKISQNEIVSEDGKTAGDVLTYVSELIEDGDTANDQLALDLAKRANTQQIIDAGLVNPSQSILYKQGAETESTLANRFWLYQNNPNPFNPTTTITYDLQEKSNVTLTIYNSLGQQVRTMVNGQQTAGTHKVVWDGRDEAGNILASGVYLYRLRAGGFVETKKMMLIK